MYEINCIKYHDKGILCGKTNGNIRLHQISNFNEDYLDFTYEKSCNTLASYKIDLNKFVSSHDTDLLFWDIRNPTSPFNSMKVVIYRSIPK